MNYEEDIFSSALSDPFIWLFNATRSSNLTVLPPKMSSELRNNHGVSHIGRGEEVSRISPSIRQINFAIRQSINKLQV